MWNTEKYLQAANKYAKQFEIDFPTSSKPKLLFLYTDEMEDWNCEFNKNNWNGYDLLRTFLLTNLYDKDIKFDNIIDEVHITANCRYDSDNWSGYILIEPINNDTYDLYTISWYKHRGRTDTIQKNGELITLDDYILLLNLLNIEE